MVLMVAIKRPPRYMELNGKLVGPVLSAARRERARELESRPIEVQDECTALVYCLILQRLSFDFNYFKTITILFIALQTAQIARAT